MSEHGYRIGDEIETGDFGKVRIIDIYISETTLQRVYEVIDSSGTSYYCDANSFYT